METAAKPGDFDNWCRVNLISAKRDSKVGPLPYFAATLLDQRDIAEFMASGPRRLFSGHAIFHQVLDLFFEVLSYRLGKIAVATAAREDLIEPSH
jgi:hypothetical protein